MCRIEVIKKEDVITAKERQRSRKSRETGAGWALVIKRKTAFHRGVSLLDPRCGGAWHIQEPQTDNSSSAVRALIASWGAGAEQTRSP
eukprot:IDg13633t1